MDFIANLPTWVQIAGYLGMVFLTGALGVAAFQEEWNHKGMDPLDIVIIIAISMLWWITWSVTLAVCFFWAMINTGKWLGRKVDKWILHPRQVAREEEIFRLESQIYEARLRELEGEMGEEKYRKARHAANVNAFERDQESGYSWQ